MLSARIVKRRTAFTIDVHLNVESGAALGLFGASGTGKSTVLACIAGTENPDGGRIVLDDDVLFPPARPLHLRKTGYLTQDANLFPHLLVRENIRFGLNGAAGDNESWIGELRSRLDLGTVWDAPAHAVSGGQARRIALARMLAPKPRLVLLDEPFTGLDRNLVRSLLDAIDEWQRALRFTMIVVDHEAEILERLCRRAIVLEGGRIVADAEWSDLRAYPATPLLADLLAPL